MPFISPITLSINSITGDKANFRVRVSYTISPNEQDLAKELTYREVCDLIGVDTPGDGTDDVLRTLLDQTTKFNRNAGPTQFTRNINRVIPKSVFNEDNVKPLPEDDEILAQVTMTPITRLQSNVVVIGTDGIKV